ncbi:MAG: NifB/NifX family molybdenum-iron cluster-binding protein [Desulfohalobiaceae bacterium]
MQLAISTSGKEASAPLTGFGRASGFILYDTEKGDSSYLSNAQNMLAARGAGAKTAQDVAQAGVQAVITGKMGPKAADYLQGKNIKIYLASQSTVQEAIQAYHSGSLQELKG